MEWRANKVEKTGFFGKSFVYVCGVLKKNGDRCHAPPHFHKASIRRILDPESLLYKRSLQRGHGSCKEHLTEEEKEELLESRRKC